MTCAKCKGKKLSANGVRSKTPAFHASALACLGRLTRTDWFAGQRALCIENPYIAVISFSISWLMNVRARVSERSVAAIASVLSADSNATFPGLLDQVPEILSCSKIIFCRWSQSIKLPCFATIRKNPQDWKLISLKAALCNKLEGNRWCCDKLLKNC